MLPLIDVHSHYIASDPKSMENYRRLVASPEIDRVVVGVLDLKLRHSDAFPFMTTLATTNDRLAGFIDAVGSPKLVPFCYIDPRKRSAPKELERRVKRYGCRGAEMYPPIGWTPGERRTWPAFRAAEELGVPVFLHMGRTAAHPELRSKFAQPMLLEDLGLACPKLKLILGHFAAPWSREACHLGMGFPTWWFDLSTSGSWERAAVLHCLRHPDLGLGKLVLGTNGNGANNLELAARTVRRLRGYAFTDDQIDAVVRRNAKAIFG